MTRPAQDWEDQAIFPIVLKLQSFYVRSLLTHCTSTCSRNSSPWYPAALSCPGAKVFPVHLKTPPISPRQTGAEPGAAVPATALIPAVWEKSLALPGHLHEN